MKETILPPIEDKIQQIFKFLEIADISDFHGKNVFEAGDADNLHDILKTAFEQVLSQQKSDILRVIEGKKRLKRCQDCAGLFSCDCLENSYVINSALDEIYKEIEKI